MIGHGTGRPRRSVSGDDATTTTALAAGAGRRGGRRGCWAAGLFRGPCHRAVHPYMCCPKRERDGCIPVSGELWTYHGATGTAHCNWSCISNARTDVAVMRNASALRPLPLKSKLELSFWISFRLNLFIWSKNEFHFAFWPFR